MGKDVETAFDYLDRDEWERLKKAGVVQIADPGPGHRIKEYEPVDLHVGCTDPKANTYILKHGLQFEWEISFVLILVAGLHADACLTSLPGLRSDHAELFVWGVAADQTRNLLQNLDTVTQGQNVAQAPA